MGLLTTLFLAQRLGSGSDEGVFAHHFYGTLLFHLLCHPTMPRSNVFDLNLDLNLVFDLNLVLGTHNFIVACSCTFKPQKSVHSTLAHKWRLLILA